MNDFADILDQMIRSSKANTKNRIGNKWKICVALANNGWTAYECEKVENSENDEIIIKWKKAGKKDKLIKLSFMEQKLWLEYQENVPK